MKYLFIVQGEGRGHLTQAISLEKMLRRNGHEVVGIMVGKSPSRKLPDFFLRSVEAPVEQFETVNFMTSATGRRPDMFRSILYNVSVFFRFFPSIRLLRKRILESGADVVVNFYELLTGMTYMLYRLPVPYVCIAHQYLFMHRDMKLPHVHSPLARGLMFFTKMTSVRASAFLALSFRKMDDDVKRNITVVPPLLRQEVLSLVSPDGTPVEGVGRGGYILGYMLNSGFSEDVLEWHAANPDVELRFFWDRWSEGKVKVIDGKLSFHIIDDKEFLKQMKGCGAYASTAGFESVCEAMYLGKPILMVPSHIEQEMNAYDAMSVGAGISSDRFDLSALMDFAVDFRPVDGFVGWVQSSEKLILEALEKVGRKNK